MSPRLRILVAFLLVYVVWGSTYFAILFVVESVPPMIGMGTRFISAGAILFALARARGEAPPTALQWRGATIVGALLFLAGNGGVAWAESRGLASGTASLLVATMPLWMTLFARLRGERTPRAALLGLAIGFVGTALLVRPGGGAPMESLIVAGGAGGWALGSLLSRELPLPKTGMMSAASQMLAGGTLLLVAGIMRGESMPGLAEISQRAVLGWLYLVVFGSVLAFSAYSYLLRHVAPAKVGTYAYVNPVVAVLLGALVGEAIEPITVWAMALVLGGVAVTVATRRPPAASPIASTPVPSAVAAPLQPAPERAT